MKSKYENTIQELEGVCTTIRAIQGEIGYTRSTLPQACQKVGRHTKERYGRWLLALAEAMETHSFANLGELWKVKTLEQMDDWELPDEVKRSLSELGNHLIFLDSKMQERELEHSLCFLMEQLEKWKKEKKEKIKLGMTLSLSAGAFVILILL